MERQAHCRQTVRRHMRGEENVDLGCVCFCCSLKCTENRDILLLIKVELCPHMVLDVGLWVYVY